MEHQYRAPLPLTLALCLCLRLRPHEIPAAGMGGRRGCRREARARRGRPTHIWSFRPELVRRERQREATERKSSARAHVVITKILFLIFFVCVLARARARPLESRARVRAARVRARAGRGGATYLFRACRIREARSGHAATATGHAPARTPATPTVHSDPQPAVHSLSPPAARAERRRRARRTSLERRGLPYGERCAFWHWQSARLAPQPAILYTSTLVGSTVCACRVS